MVMAEGMGSGGVRMVDSPRGVRKIRNTLILSRPSPSIFVMRSPRVTMTKASCELWVTTGTTGTPVFRARRTKRR